MQHRPTLTVTVDMATTAPRPIRLPPAAWVATAVVAVAATATCAVKLSDTPAVFACCYFAAVGTVLSAIDIAVMRLPDALTLPSYPLMLIALAWSSSAVGDTRPLYRGIEGAIVLLAVFATQHLSAGVGLGDVKLAGLVGLLLGYLGWVILFRGMLIACLIGAVWAATRLAWSRRGGSIPFGPALVAGALTAMLTQHGMSALITL